jgi:hypothetical protein
MACTLLYSLFDFDAIHCAVMLLPPHITTQSETRMASGHARVLSSNHVCIIVMYIQSLEGPKTNMYLIRSNHPTILSIPLAG